MSLEQTVDNLEIRYANAVTFVGTSNTMIDTTTGRIQTKGFQHNSNVITDISGPHGRVAPTLKKYPEIVFEEGKVDKNIAGRTYTQAGYTVTVSSQYDSDPEKYYPYELFNGILDTSGDLWVGLQNYSGSGNYAYTADTSIDTITVNSVDYKGDWVQIKTPYKIQLSSLNIRPQVSAASRSPKKGILVGSTDGTNWEEIYRFTNETYTTNQYTIFSGFTNTNYYNYFRLLAEELQGSAGYFALGELELYGYEELATQGDHSVDTTFMSRFNNPQTTGVQVLVDGATGVGTNQISGGPDPSGNQSTYDSTGKYWTLNGTLTSNLAVEANTFLEGDQPHAVSVWFNSSNLEANVSNTCVFSISDQEKLDSVNLDLQSNTWHNLTYAYQGEGGSRVTYLDGRKVAEDQAEDTFGDYPPFAMTGYSQGGYVVSASSADQSAYPTWKAFNDGSNIVSNSWEPVSSGYNTGTRLHTAGVSTTVSDTPYLGDWIQMEFPFKLKPSNIDIMPQVTYGIERIPGTATFAGSQDGITWTLIRTVTNNSSASGTYTSFPVNSEHAYKYIRIIATQLTTAGTNTSFRNKFAAQEIRFYGHRENDLVRLPDPTNVLKYPHIAMTGPARRGYVVSASSNYSTGTPGSELRDFGAFSGAAGTGYGQAWLSGTGVYSYVNGSYTASPQKQHHTGSANGEWLQIEMPHKIQVTKFILQGRPEAANSNQGLYTCFKTGEIWGSEDGTTWVEMVSSANFGTFTPSTLTQQHTLTVNSTSSYKYFAIIVTSTNANSSLNNNPALTWVSIGEWQIFGTGVDSVPIQIGGGNIDRVANFRVYDKFVGEDQALEIWDAQKDEFGRAKSSMTLQKGRLGIGTDEPQGRLAVADEPHNLEEFPPRAGGFDGDEWYIEGHGTFKASASNYHDSTNYYPGRAFTKSLVGNVGYASNSSSTLARWLGNNGLPNQSSSDPVGTFQGHQGDWLELELPYRIRVKSFQIQTRIVSNSPGDHPKNGFLYGSNNRENWTQITEFTNLSYTPSELDGIGGHKAIWNVNSETGFKYLRLLTTQKIDGSDSWVMISELKYFGTREQGQSVLHDGQLTLTKSLNVPRIGPALDADDTPRRDRLVVEYNTSTNPTFEGAVRDTSGRGNDGVFYGGAHYDATEKALRFDGSGDYVEGSIHNSVGEWLHSVSMWFKQNTADSYDVLFHLGDQSSGKAISMRRFSSGEFRYNFYDANTEASFATTLGRWYHLAFTYSGGTAIANRKIYLNGVELTVVNSSGTPVVLNLNANEKFTLATQSQPIEGQMNCDISNFKLYHTVLTAEEVKRLYDMGRCDEGHHVVNFSKTRVGIGLGDGETPRGALDVRGNIIGGCPAAFSVAYNPTSLSGNQTIIWNLIYHNVGGGYNSSNGLFTAPVSGYYHFTVWGMTSSNTSGVVEFQFEKNGSTVQQRPYGNAGSNYGNATGSIIEYLNIGDTMSIFLTNSTTMYAASGQSYNGFSGFYLSS